MISSFLIALQLEKYYNLNNHIIIRDKYVKR